MFSFCGYGALFRRVAVMKKHFGGILVVNDWRLVLAWLGLGHTPSAVDSEKNDGRIACFIRKESEECTIHSSVAV